MPRPSRLLLPSLLVPVLLSAQATPAWRVHEMTRPRPPRAAPVASVVPATPPAGAVVLFDGTSLRHWVSGGGKPAAWTLAKGYFEVKPGSGTLTSVDSFGDMQLHLEWSEPLPAEGQGQDRGNSGLFLMGRYELQILDSYGNDTYPDGQAGAMYAQHPPLYNVSRPAGQWQSYDVFFRRPRFDGAGALLSPARVTVLQNGVPVQDNVELAGPTTWLGGRPYSAHPDRLPIGLQDHSFKVRFRNIWVRPLPEEAPPPPLPVTRTVTDSELQRDVGTYHNGGDPATVSLRDGRLWLDLGDGAVGLVPVPEGAFYMEGVDAGVRFLTDGEGAVTGFELVVGGVPSRFSR